MSRTVERETYHERDNTGWKRCEVLYCWYVMCDLSERKYRKMEQ
jgi:hypothetical protein